MRDEHEYDGCETIVKDAVRAWKQGRQEVFLPLSHPPGEAQVDFGEATIRLAGQERKVALFVMALPYSGAIFVQVFSRECTETFLEGHRRALEYFGGVPQRISYDNSAIAVIEVLQGRKRKLTKEFLRLQSHYLFAEHFCLVRRANEKGHVERLLGFARRKFLVPVPQVDSLETLNRQLLEADDPRHGTRSYIRVLRLLGKFSLGQLGERSAVRMQLGSTAVTLKSKAADLSSGAAGPPHLDSSESRTPHACTVRLQTSQFLSEVRSCTVMHSLHCHSLLARDCPFASLCGFAALRENTMCGMHPCEKIAQRCAAEGADHLAFLLQLVELELIERERKAAERRLKAARFPTAKLLDEFDFSARSSVNKLLVLELMQGEYLDSRENILLVGPSGTGKTHLATAPTAIARWWWVWSHDCMRFVGVNRRRGRRCVSTERRAACADRRKLYNGILKM